MKNFLFPLLLLCLIGCTPTGKSITDQLADAPQVFNIRPGIDTMIICREGTRLRFCPNTFQTDAKTIKVEVKEVFTTASMLRNGVSTIANDGQMLASGGMVYFNVTEPGAVKINPECPVEIQMPAKNMQEDMGLFEGEETADGLRWRQLSRGELSVFNNRPIINSIAKGRKLYQENCASCHCLNQNLTGPALGNITQFRSREWLYRFTRNSQKMITSGDSLAVCLWNTWKPTLMNDFEKWQEQDFVDVYNFIEASSLADTLKLTAKDYTCVNMTVEVPANGPQNTDNNYSMPKLTPMQEKMNSYVFNAYDYGWFNCDYYWGKGFPEVALKVKINALEEYDEVRISLLIDGEKVNMELRKLPDGDFSLNETRMAQLPKSSAKIFAVAIKGSKMYMGEHRFTIGPNNDIALTLNKLSKKEINAVLKKYEVDEKAAATEKGKCNYPLKSEM